MEQGVLKYYYLCLNMISLLDIMFRIKAKKTF